jgi:hypothetical protein
MARSLSDSPRIKPIVLGGSGNGCLALHSKRGRGGSFRELQKLFGAEVKREPPLRNRRLVATYNYMDEAGEVLFQCLRYEPKASASAGPTEGEDGSTISRAFAAYCSAFPHCEMPPQSSSLRVKRMF